MLADAKYMDVKLKDIAEVTAGQSAPQESTAFSNDGYPFVRAGSLDYLCNFNSYAHVERILPEIAKKYRLKLFSAGTVIFAKSGMSAKIGRIFKLTQPAYVVSHLAVIVPSPQLNSDYLANFLRTHPPSNLIPNDAYPSIRLSEIEEIKIPLPPLEEQCRIATILDKAESIKHKRQQAIKLADDFLKSVFLDMFGDPVARKWKIVNVENLAKVTVGVVIRPAQYYTNSNAGVKAFRSLNVGEGYVKNDNWVYFTQEGHFLNSKSILQQGDVLVVRSGYPGTACIVPPAYANTNAIDLIIARPNSKILSEYLCAFINSSCGKQQILQGQYGAAQQHFNVGALKAMSLPLPPLDLQKKFADIVQKVEAHKQRAVQGQQEADDLFKALQQQFFIN